MKDQLIAIGVFMGTAFGLFWIRHLVLTIAKRSPNAALMHEGGDHRSDHFTDAEPRLIAGFTTVDNEPLPDNVEAVATAGISEDRFALEHGASAEALRLNPPPMRRRGSD